MVTTRVEVTHGLASYRHQTAMMDMVRSCMEGGDIQMKCPGLKPWTALTFRLAGLHGPPFHFVWLSSRCITTSARALQAHSTFTGRGSQHSGTWAEASLASGMHEDGAPSYSQYPLLHTRLMKCRPIPPGRSAAVELAVCLIANSERSNSASSSRRTDVLCAGL
jgi:hypothetical protein